jgi:hypothetical protein
MKLEKMNLASVQKLSRADMKKIMAGSGGDGVGGGNYKCVFPTGESKCFYYSTTPTECPLDYTGASGTVKSC